MVAWAEIRSSILKILITRPNSQHVIRLLLENRIQISAFVWTCNGTPLCAHLFKRHIYGNSLAQSLCMQQQTAYTFEWTETPPLCLRPLRDAHNNRKPTDLASAALFTTSCKVSYCYIIKFFTRAQHDTKLFHVSDLRYRLNVQWRHEQLLHHSSTNHHLVYVFNPFSFYHRSALLLKSRCCLFYVFYLFVIKYLHKS